MINIGLQLDLQSQLILQHMGSYYLLRDLFERIEGTSCFVPSLEHFSKFPFSFRTTYLKVSNAYFKLCLR